MISIGGNDYRLCLLDTNAVSEMAKRPGREFRHFVEWAFRSRPPAIACLSLFTILELRRRPNVYQAFVDLFGQFPCALTRGHEQLLEEETRAYPDPTRVNPILLGFGGSLLGRDQTSLGAALDGYLNSAAGRADELRWNHAAASIVEGMRSLAANYPPAAKSYTPSEIRFFVEWAGFAQLVMRANQFVNNQLERGEAITIDAFPSIKMTAFTVFYKFYVSEQRRPTTSDAFDVIISAPFPYVDAVITERHQCEVIRQTKRRDPFIADLQPFTLGDFRETAPRTVSTPRGR